ncbi:DDHD domain-containing protein [Mrakia frigida]|uniref:DDHD family phospholipase n=1 Tax=Mrakia frigida TaxID=29902 RepID=UPI003FCC06F7
MQGLPRNFLPSLLKLQLKPHRFPSPMSSKKIKRAGGGKKPELDIRWLHLGQPYLSLAGVPVSALSESYAAFSKKESDELERTFQALSKDDQLATRLKNPSKEQIAKLEKENQLAIEQQKKKKLILEVEKEADEMLEEEEERLEQVEEDAEREMTVEELELAEGEMGVPIAKDGLFEVDVKEMKLYPVFWLHKGPNIPVRRGRWFYDEKTPCPDELADDLEKGWEEAQSWKPTYPEELTSRLSKNDDSVFVPLPTAKPLGFGSHVLYQDDTTAEVVHDKESITSKLSQTFWAALRASGTYSGGNLVYRGWDAVQRSEGDAIELPNDQLEEGVEIPSHKENGEPGEPAASEVKELFLVVHGIGQQLASTHESFNSVYDSNTLRIEAQKQAECEAVKQMMGGDQVQFLPIQWRGSLKFKTASTTEEDETHSLSNRFALEDITLKKTIPYVRELINNVLLDIPFYLSKHRESMIEAVATEANRTYRLWTRRHPDFEKNGGRVHIIGHSLGSALVANILSNQPTLLPPLSSLPKSVLYKTRDRFIFSTHSLFLVGSPLGLFLHIEQAQIVPRRGRERTTEAPVGLALDRAGRFGCFSCDRIYNIFEPADPVAYMLNATVDGSLGRKIEPISIPSATQSTLDSVFGSFSELAKSLPTLPDLSSLPAPPWSTSKDEGVSEKKTPRFPEQKVLRQTESEKAQTLSLAEQRFLALNPHGSVDFFLPAPSTSVSEYLDMISAHGLYWSDPSFAAFLLTEVFSKPKPEEDAANVSSTSKA